MSSGLEVQTLEGITPQTIFFSARSSDTRSTGTSTADGMSLSPSLRSQPDGSFSGRMARKRLSGMRLASEGSVLSPLEELRRRMASTSSASSTITSPTATGETEEVSSASTSIPRASSPLSSQGRLGIKAAPAIASQRANAIGTMTELSSKLKSMDGTGNSGSNQTTPVPSNAPTVRGEDQGFHLLNEGPSFSSTYDGNDPYIRAHLETVYLRNYRDRAPEFGPRIGSGSSNARRRTGGGRTSSSLAPGGSRSGSSNKRPEGNLIAYFTEHSSRISCIAVSPDQLFFVSGSQDGTIKIWDTIHLEKNVTSKSRGTYSAQKGEITCLITLESSHCVASASTDGSLHVWRVEVSNSSSSMPKYSKPKLVSNFQLSTPNEYATCLIQNSNNSTNSSNSELILGTTHSRITVLDLRTMSVLLTLQNPIQDGPISCLCTDKKKNWLLVGTIGGVLNLWDLRFNLLLKSWRVGSGDEKDKPDGINEVVKINQLALHPGKGKGRWVMVAYEKIVSFSPQDLDDQKMNGKKRNRTELLVETWDIEKGVCVETFEVGSFPKDSSSNGNSTSQKASDTNGTPEVESETTISNTNAGKENVDQTSSDLSGPAAAIERLIKLSEKKFKEKQKSNSSSKSALSGTQEGDDSDEDENSISMDDSNPASSLSASSRQKSNESGLRPIPKPSSNVKSMLLGIDSYSSSSAASVSANSDQVAGGWLDAGKLVKDSSSSSGNGPAGFMITGGEDRKIRFWDLGRSEKGVCLGLVDERSEFR